jgi:hypothetical protein
MTQRHPVQLVIDKGDQPVECLLVTITPEAEQGSDIAASRLLDWLHPVEAFEAAESTKPTGDPRAATHSRGT